MQNILFIGGPMDGVRQMWRNTPETIEVPTFVGAKAGDPILPSANYTIARYRKLFMPFVETGIYVETSIKTEDAIATLASHYPGEAAVNSINPALHIPFDILCAAQMLGAWMDTNGAHAIGPIVRQREASTIRGTPTIPAPADADGPGEEAPAWPTTVDGWSQLGFVPGATVRHIEPGARRAGQWLYTIREVSDKGGLKTTDPSGWPVSMNAMHCEVQSVPKAGA